MILYGYFFILKYQIYFVADQIFHEIHSHFIEVFLLSLLLKVYINVSNNLIEINRFLFAVHF